MAHIEFRMMEEGDFGEITELMVRSFFHSTLYTWIAPDEEERLRILNNMFRYRVRSWLSGAVITELALERGTIVGSATWVPPRDAERSGADQTSPPAGVFEGLSPGVVERWLQFQPVIEAQEKTIPQPCWDLAPIAVSPEAQGRGIGSLLLRRKLREIDGACQAAFLATQDRNNLGIYEHFGFRKIDEIPIVPGGPVSFSMFRGNNASGSPDVATLPMRQVPV
jgi:ribosomal protein S18 acetylase RimI-like enzyme